eukprot:gene21977-28451_t
MLMWFMDMSWGNMLWLWLFMSMLSDRIFDCMRSVPSGNDGMPAENMSESHDLFISLSERSEA